MPASRASCGEWKSTGCAVDEHLAGVGPDDAAEELDQRRLAGAVLAHQRPHLAGAQRDVAVAQRAHGAVGLRCAAQLDERRARLSHQPPTACGRSPRSLLPFDQNRSQQIAYSCQAYVQHPGRTTVQPDCYRPAGCLTVDQLGVIPSPSGREVKSITNDHEQRATQHDAGRDAPARDRRGAARLSGSIAVADVEARFGVSPMTARRDLDELERQGVLRRTHGGGVLPTTSAHEDSFARRLRVETEAKERLAPRRPRWHGPARDRLPRLVDDELLRRPPDRRARGCATPCSRTASR